MRLELLPVLWALNLSLEIRLADPLFWSHFFREKGDDDAGGMYEPEDFHLGVGE